MNWDHPEGWDGEGGGKGVQDGEHVNPWLIHVNVWQKPLQYGKVISLQLIKINEKNMMKNKLGKKKNRIKEVLVRIWRNWNPCTLPV